MLLTSGIVVVDDLRGFLKVKKFRFLFAFISYIDITFIFISYQILMEKEKFHKDSKTPETTSDDEDEDGVGIPHVFVT